MYQSDHQEPDVLPAGTGTCVGLPGIIHDNNEIEEQLNELNHNHNDNVDVNNDHDHDHRLHFDARNINVELDEELDRSIHMQNQLDRELEVNTNALQESRSYRMILFYSFGLFLMIRIWMAVIATMNIILMVLFSCTSLTIIVFIFVKRREYANRVDTNQFLLTSMLLYAEQLQNQMREEGSGSVYGYGGGRVGGLSSVELEHLYSTCLNSDMITTNTTNSTNTTNTNTIANSNANAGSMLSIDIPSSFISLEMQEIDIESQSATHHGTPSRSIRVVCDRTCTICLDEFEIKTNPNTSSNDCITVLPCKHVYHQDCIYAWLANHNDCPLCKRLLVLRPDGRDGLEVPVVDEEEIRPTQTV